MKLDVLVSRERAAVDRLQAAAGRVARVAGVDVTPPAETVRDPQMMQMFRAEAMAATLEAAADALDKPKPAPKVEARADDSKAKDKK
jgi:hypothetical protein